MLGRASNDVLDCRPGHVTGARIETFWSVFDCQLKQSPRSRDRGAD